MSILEGRMCSYSVGRKAKTIVSAVTIRVQTGELLGIIGPNGAGKSTLLKLLVGILPSRHVFVDDRPIHRMTAEDRARHLAYIPQFTPVVWPMRCRDVVALGRIPHSGTSSATHALVVQRALRETDTQHLADQRWSDLSGGERALVGIARALAVEAPFLLADEPIAHLDPAHQLHILSLLKARARAGEGVVVVVHDLTSAARFCDRLCVIDQGRVVADGPPQDVLTDTLLESVFSIRPLRGTVCGEAYVLPWDGVGCRVSKKKAKKNERGSD